MLPKEEEEAVDDGTKEEEGLMVVVAVLVERSGSALVFMEDLQFPLKKFYRFRVHVCVVTYCLHLLF
jgi:hypothetical protein